MCCLMTDSKIVKRVLERASKGSGFTYAATWSASTLLAVTGFLSWRLQERWYDAETVASATSIFALITFMNFATSFGVPPTVTRFSSEQSGYGPALFSHATWFAFYTTAIPTTLVLLVLNGSHAAGDKPLSIVAIALVALISGALAISTIVDAQLFALGRHILFAGRVFASIGLRAVLISLLKEPGDGVVVFCAMMLPLGATGLLLIPIVKSDVNKWVSSAKMNRQELVGFALSNYWAHFTVGGVILVAPVIVARSLTNERYIGFFLGWSVVSAGFFIIQQIGLMSLGRIRHMADERQVVLKESIRVGAMIWAFVIVGNLMMLIPTAHHYEVVFGKDSAVEKFAVLKLWFGLISLGPYTCLQIMCRNMTRNRMLSLYSALYAAFMLSAIIIGSFYGSVDEISSWWFYANVLMTGVMVDGVRRLYNG